MQIETDRLVLRSWADKHRAPVAELSSDTVVMEHLLPLATREASDQWIDRQIAHDTKHGFCFWAVEAKRDGGFVGAVGLLHVRYEAHFTPAVEVGWRVSRAFWGLGYAPEAAAASIRFGFETLKLPQIVANTAPANEKSRRVMEKLGMSHDVSDDFDHPLIPENHPLCRQLLYRLLRDRWALQVAV